MNYFFWFLAAAGVTLALTFLLRKALFILDAMGVLLLPPKKRFCQKKLYFDEKKERLTAIENHLKEKHFSVHKKNGSTVFFSTVFAPYPLRIEMSIEKRKILLLLSDAHCQMTISRIQLNKFMAKIGETEKELSEILTNQSCL